MASDVQSVLEKLVSSGDITREEIILLLENRNGEIQSYLAQKASAVAREPITAKTIVITAAYDAAIRMHPDTGLPVKRYLNVLPMDTIWVSGR